MAALAAELDAINTMLSIIRESPVNTMEDSGLVDAKLAKQIHSDQPARPDGRVKLEPGRQLYPGAGLPPAGPHLRPRERPQGGPGG